MEFTSSEEDRRSRMTLSNVFLNHPIRMMEQYFELGRDEDSTFEIVELMQNYTVEWMKWHSSLCQLIQDPYNCCPLITRFSSEMRQLLKVLAGVSDGIDNICAKYGVGRINAPLSTREETGPELFCWRSYSMWELMYSVEIIVHPATRPAISDILNRALSRQCSAKEAPTDEYDESYPVLLQCILDSKAEPVVQFLYGLSVQSKTGLFLQGSTDNSLADGFSLVALSACVHLSLLLVRCNALSDRPTESGMCSFSYLF